MSDTCEHCGGRVLYYRQGCPTCGAPGCCKSCCRIAELEAENERLRTEIEALEDEVEQADEDAAQRARWESLSPAEREQAIKVNL